MQTFFMEISFPLHLPLKQFQKQFARALICVKEKIFER